MEFQALAFLAIFVLAYSLVSRRLQTTLVTGPMLFVAAGMLAGPTGFDLLDLGIETRHIGARRKVTSFHSYLSLPTSMTLANVSVDSEAEPMVEVTMRK